ncbi:MAG: AEC family transporter [Flexilinea sp.]
MESSIFGSNLTEYVSLFLTLFVSIIFGFIIRKTNLVSEDTIGDLSKVIFKILLPIYLFFVTLNAFTVDLLRSMPIPIISGIVFPAVICLLVLLLLRIIPVEGSRVSAFTMSAMFGNTGFLGIPICAALFANDGAFNAAIFDFGTSLIFFSLGLYILGKVGNISIVEIIREPIIIMVILGVIFGLFNLQIPEIIAVPVRNISDIGLQLSLIVVGAQLVKIKMIKRKFIGQLAIVVLIKMGVMPAIAYLCLFKANLPPTLFFTIVILCAMPCGLAPVTIGKNYHSDTEFSASCTIVSTLISMIYIPVLAAFLIGVK